MPIVSTALSFLSSVSLIKPNTPSVLEFKLSCLIFGLFISSCGKPGCKECQLNNQNNYGGYEQPHVEICRDDFSSRSAYKEYIDLMEQSGYDCKSDMFN